MDSVAVAVTLPLVEVVRRLDAAARQVALALELAPDQVLDGALAGWAYAGNASGTPAGRLDVAEVCVRQADAGRVVIELTRVAAPVPSRFEKQLHHHELTYKLPLLWSAFARAAQRQLGHNGVRRAFD